MKRDGDNGGVKGVSAIETKAESVFQGEREIERWSRKMIEKEGDRRESRKRIN